MKNLFLSKKIYLLLLGVFLNPLIIPLVFSIEKNLDFQKEGNFNNLTTEYLKQGKEDEYIIGPGDVIEVIVSREYPELNSIKQIDLEGKIYLPKINRIYVEGLTLIELNNLLNQAFGEYVRYPNVEVYVVKYRPLKFTILGEVQEPGKYTINGGISLYGNEISPDQNESVKIISQNKENNKLFKPKNSEIIFFPKLFDAIQAANGITEFSDLSDVEVIRIDTLSNGGGFKKTNLNFINSLEEEMTSSNIRIFDGDTIIVKKLDKKNENLLEKSILARLNPKFVNVYVAGRVESPGQIRLPIRSSLSDALLFAGGTKTIKGDIRFIRFKNDATVEKRNISRVGARRGSYSNPILKEKDLIYIKKGIVISSTEVLQEISAPFVNVLSTYGLIKAIQD